MSAFGADPVVQIPATAEVQRLDLVIHRFEAAELRRVDQELATPGAAKSIRNRLSRAVWAYLCAVVGRRIKLIKK